MPYYWFYWLWTYHNFALLLSHYLATSDTHSVLFICLDLHAFSAFIATEICIYIWDLHLRFVASWWLDYHMAHQAVGYCWIITRSDESMFLFDESILLFLDYSDFFGEKLPSIDRLFLFITYYHAANMFLIKLTNFKFFDSLLGKGWWYTSSIINNNDIRAYKATQHYLTTELIFSEMRQVLQQLY